MIPEQRLSTRPVPSPFLFPDSLVSSAERDYEMGGIALNDPSQGLMYQPWTFWTEAEGGIFCGPMGDEGVQLLSVLGVTSVSGTFDRNMRPAVAYTIEDAGYLWAFDTLANEMTTTEFLDISEMRVAHDDKRPTASFRADVILAYTRGGNLYYRQQRDRYLIERLLQEGVEGTFRNMGMNTGLRLQFEIN